MDVYILVDSSWSMKDSKDRILHELNQYISEQPRGTRFSVYFFNQSIERVINNERFIVLTEDMYDIWGRSAFYDSIDIVIRDAAYKSISAPRIAIYTDGIDTASIYCTKEQMSDVIRMKKRDGWHFDFLHRNPFKERNRCCGPIRNWILL